MKRKWIVAAALVLAVVGIALPWGTGYLTKQQWQLVSQEVNNSQTWLEMQVGHYDRGFWSSGFEGTMILRDPGTSEEWVVPYQANVTHGLIGSLTDFKPVNGWAPEGERWFGAENPRLTTETRLWGTSVTELTVPEFNIVGDSSADTVFGDGGVLRVKTNISADSVEISSDVSSLVVASQDLDLRLSNLTLEQQMQRLSGNIWTGEGTLNVASLELMPPAADAIVLRGLVVHSLNEAVNDGKALDSAVHITLDELQVADDALGPHRVEFEVKGVDVAAWDALGSSMTNMQLAALAAENGDPSAFQQQMQAMSEIGEAMQTLAATGLSMGFPAIRLISPEGPIEGHVALSHPGSAGSSGALLIMPALKGDMELSIPLALAENYEAIRQQTAPLIKEGLLITEGDRLVLRATLKDLILDVNGRPLPLPPLM